MKYLRLLFAALLAAALLPSCDTFADSKRPTVAEQDALDVNWGMLPRKARGNPKMRYQYNSRAELAPDVSPAPTAVR